LQGNIAELGNNVYQYGIQEQGEKVHQNGRGNSQLCRNRVCKEIKLLVKNHQKENEPKEPVMSGKEEAKSPFMMKKYKKIL
jgi:transcriptional regulator with AAA-type ATPase domain